ncbi:hypothetical protein Fmac_004740 [Flemingia macrophylla]|uniref:Caffeoyl-CoA O-methyltransferase n=1 Tax=Flemingia macrophylla TaxID=520843 RepID=A0ABD1N5T4_9FABA
MENLTLHKNILKSPALLKRCVCRSVMNVPVDEAQFMSILLKVMNAKKTIEIGVFTGYSLLSTALALPPDGKIIGIDVDREAYETGLPFIQKAGMEHKIDFIQTDALSALHDLIEKKHEKTFDYAFVDAEKRDFIKYHELLLKLVKKGGIIAYDNTLWIGTVAMSQDEKLDDSIWQYRKPILEFNTYITNDTRVESSILSIGDGEVNARSHKEEDDLISHLTAHITTLQSQFDSRNQLHASDH